MPANRFPFAVFVGREIEVFGFFQKIAKLADLAFFVRRNDVMRFEIVSDIDPQIGPVFLLIFFTEFGFLLRQVAYMPNAGFDVEFAPQEFADSSLWRAIRRSPATYRCLRPVFFAIHPPRRGIVNLVGLGNLASLFISDWT